MTRAELLEEVLQGVLLIVGEYRGSHAEQAGYVDRKFGNVINYIRAIHLAECAWHGHIDRVIITQRSLNRSSPSNRPKPRSNTPGGARYVFYIEWFKRERGTTFASLSNWGIEEIEGAEEAPATPEAR